MRHFYVRAMPAKQTKQPAKVIDAAMIQAVQIAEKLAPCRSLINSRPAAFSFPSSALRRGSDNHQFRRIL